MVAPALIRPCLPAEMPALVALLDEEFILSRGRGVSLAQRLPTALRTENCANILVAWCDEGIVAAIVIKRFDWIAPGRNWHGAMVGLVYTRPAERGRGYASLLLRAAEKKLRSDGTAFGVLFTAQPEFYRRLGWTGLDCGVLGNCVGTGGTAARCPAARIAAIEALRVRNPGAYAVRDENSYQTLPPPAEQLEMRTSPDGTAYAIYGLRADSAYVYEFGGEASAYAPLWQDIGAAARTIVINERRGSPAQQWLASISGASWRDRKLAMWLPLAEPESARYFGEWYIPYLDRI